MSNARAPAAYAVASSAAVGVELNCHCHCTPGVGVQRCGTTTAAVCETAAQNFAVTGWSGTGVEALAGASIKATAAVASKTASETHSSRSDRRGWADTGQEPPLVEF